jgi:hypothetical protein
MGNPRTGYYLCPRCNGRDAYESTETTGAMAMTLNTPGPVDPTIVNQVKGIVMRCRDCGEQVKWNDSAETLAYKAQRDTNWAAWFGTPAGFAMVIAGIYFINDPYIGSTVGEKVTIGFLLVMGSLFLLGGIGTIMDEMKKGKNK